MIRKISILNEKGDLLDFSDREKFLLYDVSGLGVEFDNKVDIFNASVLMNSQNLKLGQLKAKLLVGQNSVNGYEIFSEMFRFLNSPPYTVIYETDTGLFYRDCVLNKLTKSDMKKGRVFIEDIIFDFLTPFYKEIAETYKPTSDTEGDGKIYAGANNQMNLIADPNFEDRSTLYWLYIGDEPGGFVRLPPKSDKPNSNIVQLISSGNREAGVMNSWGMTVKEGDRLSFMVDIRTEGNPDFTRPVIRLGDVANNRTYRYSDFGIISNSNDFKTAMISFVVDHDGDFTITLLNKNVSTLSEMSTYFREPMLIRGDIADMPPDFYPGKPSNNYYVYPYVYESDYNGKSGVFQIENNSVYIGSAKGSPVEITVHGPCTNPYWEILDGSKVVQSDGYNIDVPDGYKLVVSSIVQNQRMKLIAPDGTISDVYQQQDLSRSNLIAIPEGHVTLAFHNVGDVSFVYREEYITV